MIRRLVFSCIFSLILLATAWSQTDPFMPPNPLTMGMGGSFTANAEGYSAFFYNPAGFARKSEFTLLSTNVYGVLDKTLYDLATKMVAAAAQGKDPMSVLTAGAPAAKSRAGTSASALSDYGIDIDPAAIDAVTETSADVAAYLEDVAASPNGDAALAAGLDGLIADPSVAAALEAAGVDTSDPAAMAELSADPGALAAALLPILLDDPTAIATLMDGFIATVEAESGVAAPASVTGAGDALQSAIDAVVAGLTDFLPSGNANVGAMIGMGYVGKGLGIGLFANVNAGLYTPSGKSILSSMARASTYLTLAGGYAFNIGETLSIGFQVRPTIMGNVSFLPSSLLMKLLSGSTLDQDAIIAAIMTNGVYKGFRIGVDVGALWDIGDFTLGLAIKDLIYGTEVYKRYSDFDELIKNIADFKGAAAMDSAYKVPSLKVNIGVQWHPDLGVINDVFDPRIGLDIMDIAGWIRQIEVPGASAADQLAAAKMKAAMMSDYNFLQMINFGAQIKLFKFLTFSAGLGQGMATAGLGIRLLVLDINAAVGARYKTDPATGVITSKTIDDFSEVGFSLELAILRLN